MNSHREVIALTAATLASCGSYTNPGTGTHTLAVQATLAYQFAGNTTAVDVTISDAAGNDITDANVTVTDPDSNSSALVPHLNRNRYSLGGQGFAGYHRRVELNIKRQAPATDGLIAKLEGPGPDHINSPAQDDILSFGNLGSGLDVVWATGDGLEADRVTISLNVSNYSKPLTDDSGKLTIPKNDLNSAVGQTETVNVDRTNSVTLAGGIAPNSTMTLSYGVSNQFNLQP